MDAAARLPDTHSAPGEPAAGLPGAERVRQARRHEQHHPAGGDPRAHGQANAPTPGAPAPVDRSTPPAEDGHRGADDRHRGVHTDPTAPAAGQDAPAADGAADAGRAGAGREHEHQQPNSAATADEPGERPQDAEGPGSAGQTPTPPGTAGGGTEPRATARSAGAGADAVRAPSPAGAPAPAGPGAPDEVARRVGLPADSPGGLADAGDRPVDVEGVQRAFGEHAETAFDYLRRRREGDQR